MKKAISVLAGFSCLLTVSAQQTIRNADGSYFKSCSHFEVSRPLSELAREHPAVQQPGHREAADAKRKMTWQQSGAVSSVQDPVIQKEEGSLSAAAAVQNFDGQKSTAGYDPLDPTGMVGPNHYVQAVNSNYQIFSKTGTALTAAIDLKTLFPGSTDDGDPIVMYDKFADRWIITEFQAKTAGGNENELLFAVSKTPDPTGAYYLYTFEPDANDFADYPKFSIWSDGYYETCNCDFQKVTVYERAKMLNGDQSAGFIVIPSVANPNSNGGFFCPQTLFADGQLPPYGSPQYMFDYTDDNWGAGFKDRIRIYKITSNWTNKSGTLSVFDSLTPQPFNSYFTGGTEKDISQPGTTNKLDALDGFFSYRIPYMRWSNYNSAVMCHSVNIGTGSIVAGIRWYELRQDTTSGKWTIFQQGTYAPSDGVSRWNAGIGMDMNGSIGLAYSVSASTGVYPGARFTGRTKCDTAGKMTLLESTAIAGGSAWTSDNRWGDYSHTSLDPSDGLTFWHTNQYIGTGNSLKSRIFSFKVPACVITGMGQMDKNAIRFYSSLNNGFLTVHASGLSSDESFSLELFSSEGKLISTERINPANKHFEKEIPAAQLPAGIYYVRIVNENFQRVIKTAIHN